MVPGSRGNSTRNVRTVGQAPFGTLSLIRRAGGDRLAARAGLLNAGGCSSTWTSSVDDLTRIAAQCCDSKWRLGVSRDNSTMARRAIRSPTKTGEACGQRGVADVCRGAAGWHRRGSGRGTCPWPDGVLERPAPWTAKRSAVGKSMEPGADRPPTSNRLPGR